MELRSFFGWSLLVVSCGAQPTVRPCDDDQGTRVQTEYTDLIPQNLACETHVSAVIDSIEFSFCRDVLMGYRDSVITQSAPSGEELNWLDGVLRRSPTESQGPDTEGMNLAMLKVVEFDANDLRTGQRLRKVVEESYRTESSGGTHFYFICSGGDSITAKRRTFWME